MASLRKFATVRILGFEQIDEASRCTRMVWQGHWAATSVWRGWKTDRVPEKLQEAISTDSCRLNGEPRCT